MIDNLIVAMRPIVFLFIVLLLTSCNKIIERWAFAKDGTTQTKDIAADGDEGFICRYPIEPDIIDRDKWVKYIGDNLILDDASLDTIPAGRYLVMIQFVINSDGQISDVSIEKDSDYGLGKRAKNIISFYKNQRIPAGTIMEAYKSYRKQPITFIVEEDDETK
jgi:hypothetical protein